MRALTIQEINQKINPKSILKAISVSSGSARVPRKVTCKCSCGNTRIVKLEYVSQAMSCGCINKAAPYPQKLKQSWKNMIQRCCNKNTPNYKNYGGRGVRVCDEWKNDIHAFCQWALKNGWKEGLHLDKDTRGNGLLYSPDTCCFLTFADNQIIKTTNPIYDFHGEKLTVFQIAKRVGLNPHVIHGRFSKNPGIDIYEASRPIVKKVRKVKILTRPFRKPVNQYSTNGTLINTWPSAREAERSGYCSTCIGAVCLGKIKSHKNYIWQFAN